MSDFTQGEWLEVHDPFRFMGTIDIVAENGEYICSLFHYPAGKLNNLMKEANARLIASAPKLYELLREELIPTSDYGGTLSFAHEAKIRKVLDYIDGKEGD